MVLKLHKHDCSPPARAVMMTADHLNIPLEFIDCNIFTNEHLKEEFVQKNPLHTVPVLEDDDLVIHDSHAILIHLADVYGKDEQIYPKDFKLRTRVNQKLFFNNSTLFPRLRAFTNPLIFRGIKKMSEHQVQDIEEAYSFMEQFLTKTKFLALDHITLADIAAFTTVTSINVLIKVDSAKYPKLTAWMAGMEAQPYSKKYNARGVILIENGLKDLGAILPY